MATSDTRGGVRIARQDALLCITLDRPAKRNAVDRAVADALDAALNLLDDDPALRAGVLDGGPSVFCAGSDLAAKGDYVTARGGEYGLIRRQRRKPLIAAIEGLALGGGLEIALACDMVVAARDAQLGLPEVKRGVLPTCGALFRLLQALPPAIARELVLTGQPIDGARAHALGLVNRLSEPGQAQADARALATQIAANAPLSVQASLEAMNGLLAAADAAGWQATEAALARIRGSEDLAEGLRAFFEKRPPVWQGR
ncbi:enoyl-CoA hydratase-related protein [uncultured Pseudacidovorax sp.]|uniref:enoyl-CoA hydratase-related protein n=1 Tax=uncultured Pseudacidovorax sp. TaxID=679313 RepID=UPI0025F1E665|nr:enoyl-CoA hydratase-related protein [uncultured Pseudacidovorax sp.]